MLYFLCSALYSKMEKPKPKRYIVFDLETGYDDDNFVPHESGRFPPPHEHYVVAVGRALLDENCMPLRTACPVSFDNEKKLLQSFSKTVGHFGRSADLVSWNGRSFDLPVINARCLSHKISLPWYYDNRDLRYRYTNKGHLDLMEALSEYGAGKFMSLGAAAQLCGLSGKTNTGSSVAELIEEENDYDLGWYCINDIRITACLLARYRLLRGSLNAEQVEKVETAWDEWQEEVEDGGWDGWKVS